MKILNEKMHDKLKHGFVLPKFGKWHTVIRYGSAMVGYFATCEEVILRAPTFDKRKILQKTHVRIRTARLSDNRHLEEGAISPSNYHYLALLSGGKRLAFVRLEHGGSYSSMETVVKQLVTDNQSGSIIRIAKARTR